MGEGWGDPSGKAVATEGGAGKAPTGPLMRLQGPETTNPPNGGLTLPGNGNTLDLRLKRDGSLTDCSSHVNHPTTPNYSGLLVGATTRSKSLNLHRGGQPVGARRKSGSANGNRSNLVKSSRQQGGSVSHLISARSTLGVIRLNRAEFTISHQF
jgi:hypothetical protein